MERLLTNSASDAEQVLAWSTLALAAGTIALAIIALFQEQIREWFRHPILSVTIALEPPDCHMITLGTGTGAIDTLYLRLRVRNEGNVPANSVEVYAGELRMLNQAKQWQRVTSFLPMNLVWSHMGGPSGPVIYYPILSPRMDKHCDLANVIDPKRRAGTLEENPRLGLSSGQTSMRLNVMVYPNHKGEIVGPGQYQLDLVVAASNCRPRNYTVDLDLSGTWYTREAQMLASGVGASMRTA